jgi:hypothetical protein
LSSIVFLIPLFSVDGIRKIKFDSAFTIGCELSG